MLELRGVRHRYEGRVVLDLEQFTVPHTGTVAVVGHNGAVKSTLLRLLALLETPTEGQVLLNGTVVPRRPPASLRRRVTLVEQRPILFRGTVRENLEYGLQVRDMGRTAANGIIADVVDRLGLQSLLSRRRHELSDGEVQRVAVARALALRTDVLLLDEPASSADRAAAGALYRALAAERAARPFAVCIASHQLEDAYRWADDIRALADGRRSPVTPENLFRVELPAGDGVKTVRVGSIELARRRLPLGRRHPRARRRSPLPRNAREPVSRRASRGRRREDGARREHRASSKTPTAGPTTSARSQTVAAPP